jgi:hypothetical protein
MPNTTPEEESEEFEEFEMEVVAVRKYTDRGWMYLVPWKDREKQLCVWAAEMTWCKKLVAK